MIKEATVRITISTDGDTFHVEVLNPPTGVPRDVIGGGDYPTADGTFFAFSDGSIVWYRRHGSEWSGNADSTGHGSRIEHSMANGHAQLTITGQLWWVIQAREWRPIARSGSGR